MCKYADSCSFYQEFASRASFIWKAIVKNYCDDGCECARRRIYETEGTKKLPATILPSGSHASKAFLSLS